MEDAHGFLLSTIVAPLSGDLETAAAAEALLGPAISQADPAQAEALAARLTRHRLRVSHVTLCLLAVALFLLVWQGRQLLRDYAVLQPVYSWFYSLPDLPEDAFPVFAEQIRHRMAPATFTKVFGDPTITDPLERLFRSPRTGIQKLGAAASHRLLATGTALGAVFAGLSGLAASWEESHWIANDPPLPGTRLAIHLGV